MRRTTAALAAAAIIVGAGGLIYARVSGSDAAAQTTPAMPAVPVTAGVATARDMPVYVRGIGSVQAYNTVTVKSRVDGQIMKVDFTEGQEVKAGDLLFEIDPRPFQAALAQAEANKEKDEAQLTSAQADLRRYGALVGNGYQTRQSYDQQKALVGEVEASIKADQAQIDAAELNLQYADIRSPIDGRTGARLVDIGNMVRATDNTGLVTITQLHPIYVSFTVPQGQFETIRESEARAPVPVLAYSEDNQKNLATGKLTLIDNQIDQSTGTLHLKATFDNRDGALWPGEFVNARLIVGIDKNAVTVPARAVQRGPNGSYLFVVKPDDTVEMRTVQVAQEEDGVAVIGKGLTAGERIVVDGQYRLDDGTKVVAQAAPSGKS
ncbi:MAG TPA: efflux RND transporter periplasmic adaptor subunit [Stellaceae bacterium]|nr:efflux RND transporter periplasmic adaptor subunit [Stellaceae bacterium]